MIGSFELTPAKVHETIGTSKTNNLFLLKQRLEYVLGDFWELIMGPQEISIKHEAVLVEG